MMKSEQMFKEIAAEIDRRLPHAGQSPSTQAAELSVSVPRLMVLMDTNFKMVSQTFLRAFLAQPEQRNCDSLES